MMERIDQRRYLIPFRSRLLPQIFTDTLVIGTGVAGMRAALAAADHGDVIVLAKAELDLSATSWAQGGIAAVSAEDDSFEAHAEDTISVGGGLCDEHAVHTLVREAPEAIEELIGWGMRFDRDAQGNLLLGREGGHHHNRVLHSNGDATGKELVRCLAETVRGGENIRVFDRCFALDLLTNGGNSSVGGGGGNGSERRVLGAITYHPQYGLQIIWARATILASGGAGQVYRETTNPRVATGDGLAMAYRAGAEIADIEFMQFHPTTLYVAGASRSLISEAVRGEGAYLVDRSGRRFMTDYHDMAELAPRDVVSRAIVDVLNATQQASVFLDVRHLGGERFAGRFPGLNTLLQAVDIDPGVDLIPVRPCAHYTVGGVWADLEGRTSLPGLYACGEASCIALHGANRLASNSLLEGLIYGKRAGRAAAEMNDAPRGPTNIISDIPISDHGELDLADVRTSLRSAMWQNVGVERHGHRLGDVVDMFDFWARYTMDIICDEPDGWETQNLLTVGALMTRAALYRTESRGVHYRVDFPEPAEAHRVHYRWRVDRAEPTTTPVRTTIGGAVA